MSKGKGKRKVVIEYGRNKLDTAKLELDTYKRLKEYGIKWSDSIEMYVNLEQGKIYCVVDGSTIALDI